MRLQTSIHPLRMLRTFGSGRRPAAPGRLFGFRQKRAQAAGARPDCRAAAEAEPAPRFLSQERLRLGIRSAHPETASAARMRGPVRRCTRYACALIAALPALLPAAAQEGAEALRRWRAAATATAEEVERFGVDNCFAVCEIDDATFARMYGRSYKEECTLPRGELRYVKVLHRDLEGRIRLGELVCHRAIAADLVAIFRNLYEARYPIERMVLIDEYDAQDGASMRANNSSAFNFRRISGSERLSNHSLGLAVDINPLYNPYVRTADGRTTVDPPEAAPYADRSGEFPYRIDRGDRCCREFLEHGFTWGGDWVSLKDYQHFEKKLPAE